MDGLLSFSHGRVVLGEFEIPGIIKSISIGCNVVFSEAKEDNNSGTTKTPMGWEDSTISIAMVLPSDKKSNCYKKLEDLNRIFKGLDNKKDPKIYRIVNPHLSARGVDEVVFKSLESSEDNSTDIVNTNLKFTEHIPAVQIAEQNDSKMPGINPGKAEDKKEKIISIDVN